ncbi:hypothetical protein OJ278_003850, partial [Salmonella enterica]|nr:hypothetical protein [Salmonella enterica]
HQKSGFSISDGQLSHQGGRINDAGIGGQPLEACFVLSGGGFESLAAIADAEKAVADNTRSNGKNIRYLIISPVNNKIILTIDFLHFQHSLRFIIIE